MKLLSKLFGKKSRVPREYEVKCREARDAQRSGDIQGYARLMQEAEDILSAHEAAAAQS